MSTENSNITSEYYIIHVILKKWDLQSTKNILHRMIKLQYTDMHTNFEWRSLNWSWNSLVILEWKAWKYVDKNNNELNQKDDVYRLKAWMHENLKLVFHPKLTTTIWLSFHGLRKFSQAYQNLFHENTAVAL